MFRAAESLAAAEKAEFLISGENLVQVSSQTLSNLTSITKHVSKEILRTVVNF